MNSAPYIYRYLCTNMSIHKHRFSPNTAIFFPLENITPGYGLTMWLCAIVVIVRWMFAIIIWLLIMKLTQHIYIGCISYIIELQLSIIQITTFIFRWWWLFYWGALIFTFLSEYWYFKPKAYSRNKIYFLFSLFSCFFSTCRNALLKGIF